MNIRVINTVNLTSPSDYLMQIPAGSECSKESMLAFLVFSRKNYDYALEKGRIVVIVFEICKDYIGTIVPEKDEDWHKWADDTINRLDKEWGGFSGAQVGIAKSLAAQILKYGYGHMIEKVRKQDSERLIQVANNLRYVAPPEDSNRRKKKQNEEKTSIKN